MKPFYISKPEDFNYNSTVGKHYELCISNLVKHLETVKFKAMTSVLNNSWPLHKIVCAIC